MKRFTVLKVLGLVLCACFFVLQASDCQAQRTNSQRLSDAKKSLQKYESWQKKNPSYGNMKLIQKQRELVRSYEKKNRR